MKPTLLALALVSVSLGAEDTPQGPPPPRKGWDLTLGALGFSGASIPGSGQTQRRLLPFFKADYNERIFIGSNPAVLGMGVGVRALRRGPFTWDLGLGYAEGRRERRADVLAGMGNQQGSLWLGSAAHYRLGPLELGMSGAHGLNTNAGNRLKLSVGTMMPLGSRWMLGGNANLSASDRKGMAYEFGVDPTQGAQRLALLQGGDTRLRAGEGREYKPGGGLRDLSLGMMLGYRISTHWGAMSTVSATHLMPHVADSPLVREQNAVSVGLGIHYHF